MSKKILPIILVSFVNMLGFTILFPVLPFIVERYNGTSFTYGLILSLYAAFQFIGAPILGSLSDMYGRKPLLLLSQFGTLMSWVIFGLAWWVPTEWQLFGLAGPLVVIIIARIVDGITGGNISIANAYLSDITTKKEKAHSFGIVGAAVGLAIIIGPAIGGLSGGWSEDLGYGYLGIAVAAFVISLITLIAMWFGLTESLKERHKTVKAKREILKSLNIIGRIRHFSNNKIVSLMLKTRIATGLIFGGYVSIIGLFMIDRFQFDQQQVGFFLFLVGTFSIINQGLFVKPVVKRLGELKTLLIGMSLIGLGFASLITTTFLPLFVVFYFFLSLGISLMMPTFKAVFTNNTPDNRQGEIMGVDEGILAFDNAISPLIFGWLYGLIQGNVMLVLSVLMFAAVGYTFFGAKKRLLS